MSKKMMKRSLALSALMAFVITGSAMAADVSYNEFVQDKTAGDIISVNQDITVNGNGIASEKIADYVVDVKQGVNLTLNNVTKGSSGINITGNGNVNIHNTGDETNVACSGINQKASIEVNNLTIYSRHNGVQDKGITTSANNTVTINATGTVDIYGHYAGIHTEGSGNKTTVAITAKDFVLNSDGAAIINSSVHDVIINATDDVKITAVKGLQQSGTGKTSISGNDITLNFEKYGVNAFYSDGGTVEIEATNDLKITNTGDESAVWNEKNSLIQLVADRDIVITGNVKADAGNIIVDGTRNTEINGMLEITKTAENASIVVNGKDIIVTANEDDTDAIAVAGRTNKLTIDDSDTDTITVNGGSDSGVFVNYGANVDLVANDAVTIVGDKYGLWVQGQYQDSVVNVTAEKINVSGMFTTGGAVVNLDGDTYIKATNGNDAIAIRGDAVNNINVDEDGKSLGRTVQIDGDINFTAGANSGSDIDATVNIILDKEESYLKGNIVKTATYVDGNGNTNTVDDTVTGMNLTLENGATWTVTDNSFVNNLTANEGKIVFADNGHVDVDAGSGSLILTEDGKTADDLNDAVGLTTVAQRLGVSKEATENISAKVVMAEGDVKGETTGEVTYDAEVGEDGYFHGYVAEDAVTEKVNTKNQAIGDTGLALKLHWRAHVNDMNKRMGELRNAEGEHGVWARMVRGESEYKNVKAQYNQYQLGYDEKLSVDKRWTVGAAVTFAEGDANYGQGSTEDKSTAFAIYGSKLNNDGTFVDLIARYAHLESDLDDVNSGKGDYSTNGMSVSAEFGKRIQQGKGLWVEPQVELTYGTIDSAEFMFDGGKTVQVGDMDSLIGRIGFRIGKDLEQGNVYARASYLYDFEGETENTFSKDNVSRTIAEDLGGGWWEVGVGANINLSKATYIYADVEKTFGGEVDTNWQWNLGVRYSF